ncbi:MAG: class I SAM-dependent methyltransferase [Candidatus Melainabacteria bacterium]|nr:class I SAM-dependent methyltransferase [Candidatus Melainabacteria bacterium]
MDYIFELKPERVVEIGVFGGKSLVPMACALRANQKGRIYGIDPWDNKESVRGLTEEAFIQ